MKNETTTIIFDMMGVIFTKGHFAKQLHRLLPEVPYELIREKYKRYRLSKISNSEFWKGISDDSSVEKQLLSLFVLDDGLLPLVRKLRLKGYKLVIVSNISKEWRNDLLGRFDISNHFDLMFFSCDVGVDKPGDGIFKLALNKSDSNSANVFFIDDKLSNLVTAKRLGMKTIWVHRADPESDFKPDYEVKNLSELIDYWD